MGPPVFKDVLYKDTISQCLCILHILQYLHTVPQTSTSGWFKWVKKPCARMRTDIFLSLTQWLLGLTPAPPLERWLTENPWLDNFGIQTWWRERSNHIYGDPWKGHPASGKNAKALTLQTLYCLFIYCLYFVADKESVQDEIDVTWQQSHTGLSMVHEKGEIQPPVFFPLYSVNN